ncbi:MAG: tRNA guanosine(34) transglycosylase Tgt, partial [Candidatus Woesearchaeota archaeon]
MKTSTQRRNTQKTDKPQDLHKDNSHQTYQQTIQDTFHQPQRGKNKNPFTITATCGNARTGILHTAHGNIITPFFMPVATRASGKYIGTDAYASINAQAIIVNALITFFSPGLEVISTAGGIHPFMNFKKCIAADSGGFQMSRGMFEKTTANGAWFCNPFTKQRFHITPQKSMVIQRLIGADIAMVLDVMPPVESSRNAAETAVAQTHQWAKECLHHHTALQGKKIIDGLVQHNPNQLLFAISQGALFADLRKHSAAYLSSLEYEGKGFDGIAIGGLAIGEPQEKMLPMIEAAVAGMPQQKIRYLMGVGNPLDILEAVERGIDCFDSVFPTQNARHGTLFTWQGKVDLLSGKMKQKHEPLDEGCDCFVCKHYSVA